MNRGSIVDRCWLFVDYWRRRLVCRLRGHAPSMADFPDQCARCLESAPRHAPAGWDGGRARECRVCGEPWPCSACCRSCSGEGLTWDPTVNGNVIGCSACGGSGERRNAAHGAS